MKIRLAQPRDTMGILDLLVQIGKVHYDARPDMFRSSAQKYGASQVLSRLDNPLAPVFVAVEGEKVLGYSFCELRTYKDHPVIADHTTLYLDDLCVDESCRGQGIGKALYDYIVAFAKEKKCKNVTLNVWQCNAPAVKFYEKMGMIPQRVIMEAPLEDA